MLTEGVAHSWGFSFLGTSYFGSPRDIVNRARDMFMEWTFQYSIQDDCVMGYYMDGYTTAVLQPRVPTAFADLAGPAVATDDPRPHERTHRNA